MKSQTASAIRRSFALGLLAGGASFVFLQWKGRDRSSTEQLHWKRGPAPTEQRASNVALSPQEASRIETEGHYALDGF